MDGRADREFRGSQEKTHITSDPGVANVQGHLQASDRRLQLGRGAVLTEKIGGDEKVVAYASKVLNKTERRWPTYDKELWAIVWAIRHFRQYLVGAQFEVLTDHKPPLNAPQSIALDKDATGRRGRWAVELSTHDFTVTYRKGSDNGNADAMSRRTEEKAEEVEKAAEVHAMMGDEEPSVREKSFQNMKLEQELDPIVGKDEGVGHRRKLPPPQKKRK